MIRLYRAPYSTNVERVAIALEESAPTGITARFQLPRDLLIGGLPDAEGAPLPQPSLAVGGGAGWASASVDVM